MLKYCAILGKISGPMEVAITSSKQQHWSQKALAPGLKKNNGDQKLQLQL